MSNALDRENKMNIPFSPPDIVDCQKNSLEMDYDALEVAITENIKAIFLWISVASPAIMVAFSPLLSVRRTSLSLQMRFR